MTLTCDTLSVCVCLCGGCRYCGLLYGLDCSVQHRLEVYMDTDQYAWAGENIGQAAHALDALVGTTKTATKRHYKL